MQCISGAGNGSGRAYAGGESVWCGVRWHEGGEAELASSWILHHLQEEPALSTHPPSGIGCKRGTEAESIRALIRETLEQNQIFKESICLIASIDLKKDEEGIRICAEELGVPFVTWSAEELEQVRSEDGFTESAFVRSVAGVGNVCERSALKGAGTSRLLIRKTAHNGVTVAAAVKDYTVCMED